MVNLQKFVIVLLVLTIVLSTVSVVFNLIIFKMSSDNAKLLKGSYSNNNGNIGLFVEGNSNDSGRTNG